MVGMSGNASGNQDRETVLKQVHDTAEYLHELKALDVAIIDLEGKSSVADYFIVATVTSYAQLKGLVNNLLDFFAEKNIYCRTGGKNLREDVWSYLDCEVFIVHLMTRQAREFYALEKLWFEGTIERVGSP